MSKLPINVSDSIHFHSINTGGQSVGNGGDGISDGNIVSKPTFSFDPTNLASGSSVSVTTGNQVSQSASWDTTTKAIAKLHSTASASTSSSGDQTSTSGNDTSTVHANTTADQPNNLSVDMHQEVMAGIGGDGGSNNAAMGGEVDFHFDSTI